jgi:hypothetical protein
MRVRQKVGQTAPTINQVWNTVVAFLVPAARLELARLAAADFESATSTDFVTRAEGKLGAWGFTPPREGDYCMRLRPSQAGCDNQLHCIGATDEQHDVTVCTRLQNS